jgi:hypothetical protein
MIDPLEFWEGGRSSLSLFSSAAYLLGRIRRILWEVRICIGI